MMRIREDKYRRGSAEHAARRAAHDVERVGPTRNADIASLFRPPPRREAHDHVMTSRRFIEPLADIR
jgi:hypothetical protein